MREIKFRAWDKDLKFWEKWSQFKHLVLGEMLEDDRFEVVQYTGLKDKNGMEIYDGDILNLFCDCDSGDFNSCNHQPIKQRVAWNSEDAEFVLIEIESGTTADDFSEYLEEHWSVIGNIYENPELLKD